ncbi:DUF2254 domain-containing protein [Hoeflea sp.]|uniref:DUF2254 domain-containing protein n=1 Tax=Hoeflea sp. TaxID=1940281 RepID=UPI003A9359AC
MKFLYKSLKVYLAERLWLRPAIFGIVAVFAVVLAFGVDQWIKLPFDFSIREQTIRGLLTIMASAMLTVATFSVSVMLSAYVAAISSSTPRAFSVVVTDSTSKQAISTFIGAFTYSVVGLIGLNVGVFQSSGRIVLFFTTLWVFVWVVGTLIYWIDHVARISTVSSTISKVSDRAKDRLTQHLLHPGHGGTPIYINMLPPEGAVPVISGFTGTVQFIDVGALSNVAEAAGMKIQVAVRLGDLIGRDKVVAWIFDAAPDAIDPEAVTQIRSAIRVGQSRNRGEDPVLALQTLSEIADRALSPGINDPGTANDILDSLVEVFAEASASIEQAGTSLQHARVLVPIVEPDVILTAAFEQIARDGAGFVEVAVHLQKAMSAIAPCLPAAWTDALRVQSCRALERSKHAMVNPHDFARVEAAAQLATPRADSALT